jgi:hypothetical protein
VFLALALQPGITNNSIKPPNENFKIRDHLFMSSFGLLVFALLQNLLHNTQPAVCGFERMRSIGKVNTGINSED